MSIDNQARAMLYDEDIRDFGEIQRLVKRIMDRGCSWKEMTSANTDALTEATYQIGFCIRRAEGMKKRIGQ